MCGRGSVVLPCFSGFFLFFILSITQLCGSSVSLILGSSPLQSNFPLVADDILNTLSYTVTVTVMVTSISCVNHHFQLNCLSPTAVDARTQVYISRDFFTHTSGRKLKQRHKNASREVERVLGNPTTFTVS